MSRGSCQMSETTASVVSVSPCIRLGQEKSALNCGIEATSSYQQEGYKHIAKPIDPN